MAKSVCDKTEYKISFYCPHNYLYYISMSRRFCGKFNTKSDLTQNQIFNKNIS